jgi:hypothetical protein
LTSKPIPTPRQFEAELRKELNELRRKMLLLGYISERLSREKCHIFLVGGQAVETYTGGVFTTGDIDIATTNKKVTEELLAKLGFSKEGMIWLNEKLGIAVHLVGDYPTRSRRARTIEVGDYRVDVVGVEDLILDRLRAAKFWKSQRDAEQARALLRAFRGELDQPYLSETAKVDGVGGLLAKIREEQSAGSARQK